MSELEKEAMLYALRRLVSIVLGEYPEYDNRYIEAQKFAQKYFPDEDLE